MQERIQNFVDEGYPSRHFADQDFLEKELWAYSLNVVPEFKVCSYVTEVKNGAVSAFLPKRYGNAIKAKLARINIEQI